MWIRTQNRKQLINIDKYGKKFSVKEFYVEDNFPHSEDDETNASICIDGMWLGTYSTLDRAIRELDSIESAISSMTMIYQVTKEIKGDEHYG